MRSLFAFLLILIPVAVFASSEVVEDGVLFTYSDPNANVVFLAGDFNGWKENDISLEKDSMGVFAVKLKLEKGRYEYKFIVDGVWKEDADNPNRVPDPYGGYNSVVEVGAGEKIESTKPGGRAIFTYFDPDAEAVYLAGEFNDWNPHELLMEKEEDNVWRISLELAPGEYEYKFVVDGNWVTDPMNPTIRGDMGNSVIRVNEDGTASYPAGAQLLTNTPVSSRVLFGGQFLSRFTGSRDYPGDRRFKLGKPDIKLDVNIKAHISEGAELLGSFDVNTTDAEKMYEAHLHLDSLGLDLDAGEFSVSAFFNRELFETSDPLSLVGNYPFPEPTYEKPQRFGLGYAGIKLRYELLELLLANEFKNWAFSPDTLDFPNIAGRRQLGFFSRRISTVDEPTDFSNYGTDVLAGRISKDFGFVAPGVVFRVDKNRWWLPTSEITYEEFDSIYARENLSSDWLDLGSWELGAGGDVRVNMWDVASLWAEYIYWKYASLIEAGNRENRDRTGDGKLDIPLGKQSGFLSGAGLSFDLFKNLNLTLSTELEHYNPMDTNDVYIIPHPNDGETGRPTLTYETLPEYDRKAFLGVMKYRGKHLSAGISYRFEDVKDTRRFGAILPELSFSLFKKRIALRFKGEYSSGSLGETNFFGTDILYGLSYNFSRELSFDTDVMYKRLDTHSSDAKDYFFPYLAFIWQPKEAIRFELSTGVSPYDIKGRYTGRSKWLYDTMDENSISFVDALSRMEQYRGINIFASVRF